MTKREENINEEELATAAEESQREKTDSVRSYNWEESSELDTCGLKVNFL